MGWGRVETTTVTAGRKSKGLQDDDGIRPEMESLILDMRSQQP